MHEFDECFGLFSTVDTVLRSTLIARKKNPSLTVFHHLRNLDAK